MSIFLNALNFLLPERCISCGKNGKAMCNFCISKIPKAENVPLSWCQSLYSYKDPTIRKAIRSLKYKNRIGLAVVLAKKLHDFIFEDIAEEKIFDAGSKIILVPIPISKNRKRNRGYNQSVLIARALTRLNPKIYKIEEKMLSKIRDNTPQVETRTRRERLSNMSGVFTVTKEIPKNSTILLIDDVITTGATLSEAKRILTKGGAQKVKAFTIAH